MPLLSRASTRQWRIVACSAAGMLVLALASSIAAESKSRLARETDLKAVFLFNFTQFVEWPQESFADETAQFVIGILGDDPFGETLDQVVANESVGKHKIIVRRYRDVHDAANCQILFISASESSRLERIFDHLKGKSILTVGDSEGFAYRGGVIRFLLVENKLRLRINTEAAKAAHLTISSQLLRQSEIAEPRGEK